MRIKGQVVFFSRARLLIIFGLLPSVYVYNYETLKILRFFPPQCPID